MGNTENLLEVREVRTHFYTDKGVVKAVDSVDFEVGHGEILGLVGESGCGKSVTSLSIMRLVREPGRVVGGEILFNGRDLLKMSESELVRIRGGRISMVSQEPQSSLNPVMKVGNQIAEALRAHRIRDGSSWQRAVELLETVGIPEAEQRAHEYPHQLSGGMAQRVMIAMALACTPELLIADEPTSALDVTIQAQILDLLREVRARMHTSIILITHDLGVVAEMADRVAVMYSGQIVEKSSTTQLFARPLHPYTQGLINSIPVLGHIKERLNVIPGLVPDLVDLPPGCRFAPRCKDRLDRDLSICTIKQPSLRPVVPGHEVRCWLFQDGPEHKAPLAESDLVGPPRMLGRQSLENVSVGPEALPSGSAPDEKELLIVENLVKYFPIRTGVFQRVSAWVKAVDEVSFTIEEGETLGLVGESGCGKTTLGRTILRLIPATRGSVEFNGQEVFTAGARELKTMRRSMQIIFQDPYSSLDPRMPVGESIGEGLLAHGMRDAEQRREIVLDTMRKVGLEEYQASRYPHEFSGGQRQRIGVARALALRPKFIVCDEPVSALDVSVQSQVLNLMKDLQSEFDLTYLFIAHNLSVVEHISDRVAVMYLGKVVELARRDELYRNPLHPYTRALMSAIPLPDPTLSRDRIILEGDVPSPIRPPSGCRFHTRCPIAVEQCSLKEPPLREVTLGHRAACWFSEVDRAAP